MGKRVITVILLTLGIGFLLGWLFPVEGPVDYVYDNYVNQKVASKNCPAQKQPEKFTEEELDYINEMLEELVLEKE